MGKIVLFCFAVFFLVSVNGCRKQVSVIPQKTFQIDTASKQTDLFKDVDTSGNAVFSEAKMDDDLSASAAQALQTIYFDYNSYLLNVDATERLKIIASFLNVNSSLRILVAGHCDERGSSEYNMGLGEKRARAAKDYLVNIGINTVRIETTSYGKEQPVQPFCADENCHSKNRRDEFRVLAK